MNQGRGTTDSGGAAGHRKCGGGCPGAPTAGGRRIFPFLVLGAVALGATAAGATAEPRFDRISVEEGLSHTTVWDLLQDSRGFVWIATENFLQRYDGYQLKAYKHDPEDPESLSASEVTAIFEDRAGNLWFGTRDAGLNRFDRAEERFVRYGTEPAAPGDPPPGFVWDLLEDPAGALWVGATGGLSRLDPATGKVTRYRHDPAAAGSVSPGEVIALLEDRAGRLWIGTESGLDRLDRPAERRAAALGGETDTGAFHHCRHDPTDPSSLSPGAVAALYQDPDGDLWVGTGDGTLNRLRSESLGGAADRIEIIRYRSGPSDLASAGHPIYAVHGGRDGALWIGTAGGGLSRFDRRSETFTRYRHDPADPDSPGSDTVIGIIEDREGALWFATQAGITRLDPRRQRFVALRHRPGRRDGLDLGVLALAEEPPSGDSSLLWAGTKGGGVTALERRPGSRRESGLRESGLRGSGLRGSGLPGTPRHRFEPGGPEGLPQGHVRALLIDRRGELWVGASSLVRLERGAEPRDAGTRESPGPGPRFVTVAPVAVLSLLEDSAGNLWAGTGLGLYRFAAGGEGPPVRYVHDPEDPASLAFDTVYCLYQDRQGRLWAGTERGLSRLDGPAQRAASGTFVSYRHDPERAAAGDRDSLSNSTVTAVVQDPAGTLWVGTYGGGLNRWQPIGGGEWRHYRERDGLADDKVVALLAAGNGQLWIATNGGLSRFDPAAETFRTYDVDDGLHGNLFYIGAALEGSRGELYFGGPGGITAFFPERIEDDPSLPAVAVTGLHLEGEPALLRRRDAGSPLARAITETRELSFAHRQRSFTLEFAALHFANPQKNRYAYRLEGYDPGWIATDAGHRRARYTNLDPGSYRFRVKASNGDGVWNEEGTALAITIRPPFWGTWWFRAAGLAAVVGLLWSAHRLRLEVHRQRAEREKGLERERFIAELQAKNTELERFTYTVSHDLKSPLVTIQGFLGFLERDLQSGDAGRVAGDVGRIRGAAGKMQRLIDDLLELSRIGRMTNPPEDVALAELAGEVRELLAGTIAERGAEVVIAPDLPVVRGDRTRLRQVVQNLMQNALQYMGDQRLPRIEVGVRPAEDGPDDVLTVRDNGIGIEPQYRDTVFELFQRLDAGTEGSGVGLALVKRIVEVHGGRVWVESVPPKGGQGTEGTGTGSTFCFTLPPAADAEAISAEAPRR